MDLPRLNAWPRTYLVVHPWYELLLLEQLRSSCSLLLSSPVLGIDLLVELLACSLTLMFRLF